MAARVAIRLLLLYALPWVALATQGPVIGDGSAQVGSFSVDDYGKVRDIRELSISADGEYIAFVTTQHCYDQCAGQGRVYILNLEDNGSPRYIGSLEGASELSWKPRSHMLAALLWRNGRREVYTYAVMSQQLQRVTESRNPVLHFQYAPNGTLAYLTKANPSVRRESTIYWSSVHAEHGLIVNSDTTGMESFRDPAFQSDVVEQFANPGELWIRRGSLPAIRLRVPGDVRTFVWGPASRNIAVTYVGEDVPRMVKGAAGLEGFFRAGETSVGMVSVNDGQFEVVAKGRGPWGSKRAAWYAAGDWASDGRSIVLLRVGSADWANRRFYPYWEIVNPFSPRVEPKEWATMETTVLAWDPQGASRFMPEDADAVAVDSAIGGRNNVYSFSRRNRAPMALIAFGGDVEEVVWREDRSLAAFVGETLTNPPEIYVSVDGHPAKKVTSINEALTRAVRYRGVLERWRGADGAIVSGWLLEPENTQPPWPMLTVVHGGPLFPMTDSFARYFPLWPYPLEALASHGIAIFEPNYRGTLGYGWKFATPLAAGRPDISVLDIILGIAHLEDVGLADPQHQGICGHSAGGWPGPFAMESSHGFVASSFAEGTGSEVMNYLDLPGSYDRFILDPGRGNYFEDPFRALEESPDLHLRGISTALLLENGRYSFMEFGLAMAKAAQYANEPVEWVVYPHTGHNITDPSLLRESAERNFAWFEYWLRGEKEPGAVANKELLIWQGMRRQRGNPSRRHGLSF